MFVYYIFRPINLVLLKIYCQNHTLGWAIKRKKFWYLGQLTIARKHTDNLKRELYKYSRIKYALLLVHILLGVNTKFVTIYYAPYSRICCTCIIHVAERCNSRALSREIEGAKARLGMVRETCIIPMRLNKSFTYIYADSDNTDLK